MRAILLGLGGVEGHFAAPEALSILGERLGRGSWQLLQGYPCANPAMAWATVQSGLNPGQHGVFDALAWGSEGLVPNPNLDRAFGLWRRLAARGYGVLCVGFPGSTPGSEARLTVVPAMGHHPLALPLRAHLTDDQRMAYVASLLRTAEELSCDLLALNLSPLVSSDRAEALALADALVELAGQQTELLCLAPWTVEPPQSSLSINEVLCEMGYLRWARSDGPWWKRIDWHRSVAYSFERGDLRLNLKGREPFGHVEPGPGAFGLLRELVERFERWRPLPSAGLFWGPYARWAPDLVLDTAGVSFGGGGSPRPVVVPQGFLAVSCAERMEVSSEPAPWESVPNLISQLLLGVPFEAKACEGASAEEDDLSLRMYLEDLEQRYRDLRREYFSTAQWAASLEEELRRKNALLQAVEGSRLHRFATWARKLLG